MATRCPYTLSDITVEVSVRVFLEEIDICTSGLSKADGPPQCGQAPSNHLKTLWLFKGSFPLPDFLELGHHFFLPSDSD